MSISHIKSLALLCFYLLQFKSDAAEVCRQRSVDVVFMLDGSRSVRPTNFVLVKNYVKEFVNLFEKLGPPYSQIGVIQFASQVREEIRLNQFTNKHDVMEAIDNIAYMEMGTMTGEALKFLVSTALLPSHGSRLAEEIHTIAIIITDGRSQDYHRGTVTQWQREAKEMGVEIFAIGVGKKVNHGELNELASIPKREHVYEVENFEDIDRLEVRLSGQEICDEDECESGNHECEHICTNTDSSYECSCNEGYILLEDERSCYELIVAPVPRNIQFSQITHTSSEVSWDIGDVSDDVINHYLLTFDSVDGTGGGKVVEVYGNRSKMLYELEPNTQYLVSVSAVTNDDISSPADGTFTTLRLGDTTLTLSNATLTTMVASWQPAGGNGLTGYELIYRKARPTLINGEEPIPDVVTRNLGPDEHQLLLTGLSVDTIYFSRVTPLHGELVGGSASDEKKTLALAPPFVKVVNTTLSTLSTSWISKGAHEVMTWSVTVFPIGNEEFTQTIEVDGERTEAIFRNLEPSIKYLVEVKGHVEEGGRQFVTPKGKASKKTKMLRKPPVTVTNVTLTSLSLEWEELNIVADSWTVSLIPKGQSRISHEQQTGREQRSSVFTSLLPSTTYKIEVFGEVLEDERAFRSQVGKQKATTEKLTAPPVEIINETFTTLTAVWKSINTPVDLWKIKIHPADAQEALQELEVEGSKRAQVFSDLVTGAAYRVEVVGQVSDGSASVDSPGGSAVGTTLSDISFDLPAPMITCEDGTDPLTLSLTWEENDVDKWVIIIGQDYEDEEQEQYKVSGQQLAYNITELLPNTTYDVEVFGEIIEGTSTFPTESGRTTCTTQPLTGPPVEVIETTYSSLTVRWENINTPVDRWTVYLLSADKDVLRIVTEEGSVHEAVFNGLDEGTFYDVQVVGHITRKEAIYDSPIGADSGVTKSLISIAGPRIECMDSNLTSIQLLWSDVTSEVNSWMIHYYPEGKESFRKKLTQSNTNTDGHEYLLTRLRPSTAYVIEIIGTVYELGQVFRTQPGLTVCSTQPLAAPVVEVSNSTFHSLTAQWSDINFPVSSWIVSIFNLDVGLIQKKKLPAGTNQLVTTGLEQDTSYDFKVEGDVGDEIISPPGTSSGTTDEIGSPFVECDTERITAVTISWYNVPTAVDAWNIKVYSGKDEDNAKLVRVNGNSTEVVVYELSPGTGYFVQLIGTVTKDEKVYNTEVEYASCVTENLPRPAVVVVGRTTSSLDITWDKRTNLTIETWNLLVRRRYAENMLYNLTIDGEESEYTFEDLLPQTPYYVDIKGSFRGKSTPSGATDGRTESLTPPNVTINNPTLSSMLVEWSDINMDMSYWIVTVKQADNGVEIKTVTVDGSTKNILFDGLQPTTFYEASVIGKLINIRNETRYSPSGTNVDVTDSIDAPHVACNGTTSNTVTVSWEVEQLSELSSPPSWIVRVLPEGSPTYTEEFALMGEKREYMFQQLQPATTYAVEVVGNVVEGNRTFESPKMQDFCTTKPSPPQNLVTIERGITHLIANFYPSSDLADDYAAVCVPTNGDENDSIIGEVRLSGLIVECNDLEPATEYTITLKTIYKNLVSEPIHTLNTTLTPSPTGLTLRNATTHSMVAEWEAPEGDDPDRYFVSYNWTEKDIEVRIIDGSQTSLLLMDLEPNTKYTVRVQTEMNDEKSCPDYASDSTLPEYIELQVNGIGYTSINVSWNQSMVPHIRSYCLEYSIEAEEDEEFELKLPIDVLNYTITNLRTATEYEISIKARYSMTKSEESEKFATTLALPPIGPLRFTNVTESSFVVHWLPPDGAPQPTSYTLSFSSDEAEPITIERISLTHYPLWELSSDTLYNVTVSANYGDDLVSQPIKGAETTLVEESTCSCSTYLKTQSRMQSMLVQMMEQINTLNLKIEKLTREKRKRSDRRK